MMINKDNACLLIFNMQIGLIPLLKNSTQLCHDCIWLADLFKTHELPAIIIEHKKLGNLLPSLKQIANPNAILEKHHFSITKEPHIMDTLLSLNKKQLILAGAESHVCILQSALKLKENGFEVFIILDATSARSQLDHEAAMMRFKKNNCHLITKEMLFFELIEHSELSHYMDLSLKFLDGRYIR